MFCFVPPQEKVIIPQYHLNRIQWYLTNYLESELIGWISHDGYQQYWTILSETHQYVTPLILINRNKKIDDNELNIFTCESEYDRLFYKEKQNYKNLYGNNLSQEQLNEIQKTQQTNLLELWKEKPYLVYMIGSDDGDKAKSFCSKEAVYKWIEDTIKSGIYSSYSEFDILENDLEYN